MSSESGFQFTQERIDEEIENQRKTEEWLAEYVERQELKEEQRLIDYKESGEDELGYWQELEQQVYVSLCDQTIFHYFVG